MFQNKLSKIAVLIMVVTLMTASSSSAQIEATWELDVGDSAVYWLDDVRFNQNGEDSGNLAAAFMDVNRTTLFAITAKDASSLNYSLGLNNGSELIPNQQITMVQFDTGPTNVVIPNGTLPLILPTSTEGYSNYLGHLAANLGFAEIALQNLLEGMNITTSDLNIDTLLTGDFLNITAEAKISELEDLTTSLLSNVNETGSITLGENQTINDIQSDFLFAYNASDGMLVDFTVNAAINTTTVQNDGSETDQIVSFNATVIRKSLTLFADLISDNPNLASQAEDASFLMLGIAPALILLRRKIN